MWNQGSIVSLLIRESQITFLNTGKFCILGVSLVKENLIRQDRNGRYEWYGGEGVSPRGTWLNYSFVLALCPWTITYPHVFLFHFNLFFFQNHLQWTDSICFWPQCGDKISSLVMNITLSYSLLLLPDLYRTVKKL